MNQKIKIGQIDLADLSAEKEKELFDALKTRLEERENAESQYSIIRSDRAGAFFAIIKSLAGSNTVVLDHCRRLYYWKGACSLSQMAIDGTDDPGCQFSVETFNHTIMGVIEIIQCTKKAENKIKSVKDWAK